jgi:hypothetical protein
MPKDINFQELEAVSQSCGKRKVNCAEDLEEVLGEIIVPPTSRNIAIEFECGECCKKVLNGASIAVTDCFVILRPAMGEQLEVKLFSEGRLVERQRVQIIVIPIDHICSIEFGAVEVD